MRCDHAGPISYEPDEHAREVMRAYPLPEPPRPFRELLAKLRSQPIDADDYDPSVDYLGRPRDIPDGVNPADTDPGIVYGGTFSPRVRREHRSTRHLRDYPLGHPLAKERWLIEAEAATARRVAEDPTFAAIKRLEWLGRKGGPLGHDAAVRSIARPRHPMTPKRKKYWHDYYYVRGGKQKQRAAQAKRYRAQKRARIIRAQLSGADQLLADAKARDILRRAWKRAQKDVRKKRIGGWD
jgi:hypothetical protein